MQLWELFEKRGDLRHLQYNVPGFASFIQWTNQRLALSEQSHILKLAGLFLSQAREGKIKLHKRKRAVV